MSDYNYNAIPHQQSISTPPSYPLMLLTHPSLHMHHYAHTDTSSSSASLPINTTNNNDISSNAMTQYQQVTNLPMKSNVTHMKSFPSRNDALRAAIYSNAQHQMHLQQNVLQSNGLAPNHTHSSSTSTSTSLVDQYQQQLHVQNQIEQLKQMHLLQQHQQHQ